MKHLSIAIFAFFSLTGCGSENSEPDIMEPAPLVDSLPPEVGVIACPEVASQSDFDDGLNEHVTDPHRFLELYLGADPQSQEEAPELDFDEVDVLAMLAGAQPSGAHWVYISDVNEQDGDLEVIYVLVSPSSDCAATDQITYPYCFVSIPKVPGQVHFTESRVSACGLKLNGEVAAE